MKKNIFLATLVFILLFSSAKTYSLKETYSSVPVITLSFSEESAIINAVLVSADKRYNFSYSPPKGEYALVHRLTATQALANGNYTLYVEAQDRVENKVNVTQIIEVSVPYIPIRVINPPLGVSPTPIFDLVIETPENDASCKYSTSPLATYDSAAFSFEDITPKIHKFSNFNKDPVLIQSPEKEIAIYIFCKQLDNQRINPATIKLSYDLTPPIIGAFADPRVIVDKTPEGRVLGEIKVISTSDKIICRYSDLVALNDDLTNYGPSQGIFQEMPNYFGNPEDELNLTKYSKTPTTIIDLTRYITDITKIYNFVFNVSCINMATLNLLDYSKNRTSNTVSVPISVNLLSPIIINKISPPDYTANDNIFMNFTTNKVASCSYTLEEKSENLESADNKIHTKNYGSLPEGKYSIKIDCVGEAASISKNFSFVIDKSPPSRPIIISPNVTCTGSLTATFFSNDTESGIKGYNYTITGLGVSISGFVEGENPTLSVDRDEKGNKLNLTNAASYGFSARAVNNVGIEGDVGSGNIIIYDESGVLCDNKPPSIFLKRNLTPSGVEVSFVCIDAETRCDNSSYRYLISNSPSCIGTMSPLEYDTQREAYLVSVSSTSYFCYEAQDIAGNKARGNEKIEIIAADHCSNNIKDYEETDVDCGGRGTCRRCDIEKTCGIDSDCLSLFCANGICKQPSCDDGIKNGYETDVDCGGIDCAKCEINQRCGSDNDCITNYCSVNKICAIHLCNDSLKNGYETDVDCGGVDCPKCSVGKYCLVDSDCLSGKCFAKECVQPPIEGNVSIISEAEIRGLTLLKIIKILILIVGLLSTSGGSGYLFYKKYYVKKATKKEEPKPAPQQLRTPAVKEGQKTKPLSIVEKIKLEARKEKERAQKEIEREKIFGIFGKPRELREENSKKMQQPAQKVILPRIIQKLKPMPKRVIPKQPLTIQKDEFKRLEELEKKREEVFEKLEKIKEEEAFEKLEKIGKGKSPEKLEKLQKKNNKNR